MKEENEEERSESVKKGREIREARWGKEVIMWKEKREISKAERNRRGIW